MTDDRPDPAKARPQNARPVAPDPAVTKTQPTSDGTATANSATPGSTPENRKASTARDEGPLAPTGYELVRRLGEGGMGVVYEARDTRDGTTVALKTITDRRAPKMNEIIRFLSEAEVQASISHDHVVRVYKVGETGGRPYMVMEYLAGGTLAEKLKSGRLKPKKAASLVQKIARGVAAAHARGIFHRDLKPANILFNDDGQPKVADFGLAKRDTSDLTQTGALMGTPAYMAPEQANGQNALVGAATDVWGLGVILYECLTGKRPFKADDVHVLLGKIASDEPPSILKHAPDVPRDLERICLKCLEKDPKDRYPTAVELVDDLNAQAAGKPIGVRRVTWVDRAVKFARKRPTAVALWGLGLLAVVLGSFTAVAVNLWQDAETQRASAVSARDLADQAKGEAESLRDQYAAEKASAVQLRGEAELARDAVGRANYFRSLDLAWRAHLEGSGQRARQLLGEIKTNTKHHGWEWDYISRRVTPEVLTFENPPDVTESDRYASLTYTADGRFLCGVMMRPNGRSTIDRAHIWDAKTGKFLHAVPPLGGSSAESVVASWDGSCVLVRPSANKPEDVGLLLVFETVSGKELARLPGQFIPVLSAEASKDGSKLLVHFSSRQRVTGGAPVTAPTIPAMPAGPADQPKMVMPGAKEAPPKGIPKTPSAPPQPALPRPSGPPNAQDSPSDAPGAERTCPPDAVASQPAQRYRSLDELVLFDLRNATAPVSFPIEGEWIAGPVAILGESEVLAEEHTKGTLRYVTWSIKTRQRRVLPLDPVPVRADEVAFIWTPDRRKAMFLLKNGNAGLFDLAENTLLREYPPAILDAPGAAEKVPVVPQEVDCGQQPPKNQVPNSTTRIILGDFIGDGSQVTLWTVRTLQDAGPQTHGGPAAARPPTTPDDMTLTTHETESGRVLRSKPIYGSVLVCDCTLYSPDGRWYVDGALAVVNQERERQRFHVIDVVGNRVRDLPFERAAYLSFAFSPDSKSLAMTRDGTTVMALDLNRSDAVQLPTPRNSSVLQGYTSDGSQILVEPRAWGPYSAPGLDSDALRPGLNAYDTRTGLHAWPDTAVHPDAQFAYSRDGKTFIHEVKGDELVIREVGGSVSRSIRLPAETVSPFAPPLWSSDGRRFLSTMNGLRMWDAETGREQWSRTEIGTYSQRVFVKEKRAVTVYTLEPRTGVRKTPDGLDEQYTYHVTVPQMVEYEVTVIRHPVFRSPDNSILALLPDALWGAGPVKLAGQVDEIRLLSGATGGEFGRIPFDVPPTLLVFSRDSTRLAVLAGERALIYDVRTKQLIFHIRTPGQNIKHLAFSPDGTRMATCSDSKDPFQTAQSIPPLSWFDAVQPTSMATLWDARDGREICTIPVVTRGLRAPIYGIEFHPSGSQIAFDTGAGIVLHNVR